MSRGNNLKTEGTASNKKKGRRSRSRGIEDGIIGGSTTTTNNHHKSGEDNKQNFLSYIVYKIVAKIGSVNFWRADRNISGAPAAGGDGGVDSEDEIRPTDKDRMIISKDLLVLGDYLRLPKSGDHAEIQ